MTKSTIALSLLLAAAGSAWASGHEDLTYVSEVQISTEADPHYYRIAGDRAVDAREVSASDFGSPYYGVNTSASNMIHTAQSDENSVWTIEKADDDGSVYIKSYSTGLYWTIGTSNFIYATANPTPFYLIDLSATNYGGLTFGAGSFGISTAQYDGTSIPEITFCDACNYTQSDGYAIKGNTWNPWDDWVKWSNTRACDYDNGSIYYFEEFDITTLEQANAQAKLDAAREGALKTLNSVSAAVPGADEVFADDIARVSALTTDDDFATVIAEVTAGIEAKVATLLTQLGSKPVTMQNVRRAAGGKASYLSPFTYTDTEKEVTYETFNTQTAIDDNAKWQFIPTAEGSNNYIIQNLATGKYIGDLDDITLQADEEGADTYAAVYCDGAISLQWVKNTAYGLNVDNGTGCLTWWSYDDAGSLWSLSFTDFSTGEVEPATATITFRDAQDGKVGTITYIDVQLPAGTEPTGEVDPIFTLTTADGEVVLSRTAGQFKLDGNNNWEINVFPNVYASGTFTASIPEGALAVNGVPVAAASTEVEGTTTSFKSDVTPASGTYTSLKSITIAAPSDMASLGDFSFDDWNFTKISIKNVTTGEEVYKCTIDDYYCDYWNDDSHKATINDVNITEPGRYSMTLPYGSFFIYDDNYNVAAVSELQVINWVISDPDAAKDNVTLTVVPADGAEVETAATVSIFEHSQYSFPTAEGEGVITITREGDEEPFATFDVDAVNAVHFENDDTEEYGWALPANITEAGTYTVTVPAAMFTFYADESHTSVNGYNAEFTATFTATGVIIPEPVAIDVEVGGYNDDLMVWYIGVQTPEDYASGEVDQDAQVVVSNAQGEQEVAVPGSSFSNYEGLLYYYFYTMGKGTHLYSFPEGFFRFLDADGNLVAYSNAKTVSAEVAEDDDFTLTPNPAAGEVADLSTVSLLGNSTYCYVYGTGSELVTLTKEGESEPVYTVTGEEMDDLYEVIDSENYVYGFVLPTGVTAPGKYTLTVPAGAAVYYNAYEAYYRQNDVVVGYNEALTATWTITTSGLTDITVNGEKQEIFDLQGRKVNVANRGQVYIIGGRKVLVK